MKKNIKKKSLCAALRHEKNKRGYCWSALAISVNNGEAYCLGIYNLKAPIMSPMQFGLRKR